MEDYLVWIIAIFLFGGYSLLKSIKEDNDEREEKKKSISETAKNIAKGFGYPHKIYAAQTPYEEIVNEYNNAFERGKKEGFTPIIMPIDRNLVHCYEYIIEEKENVSEYLDYKGKSAKKILEERYSEYITDYEEDFGASIEEFIGVYEGKPEVIEVLGSVFDYTTRETKETVIFEVPTTNPWEVVAYIPFGGGNECPSPGEMMAICKYWYEEYGAIPVSITNDELEMTMLKPVSADKSLEVAKEHYAFAPDRVEQCTKTSTLSELKASIEVSRIWYFWWD